MAFLAAWESDLQAHEAAWDQAVFNNLARQGANLSGGAGDGSRLWKGHTGALTVGVLPVAAFAGGHTFFVQSLYEVRGNCLPVYACRLALCAHLLCAELLQGEGRLLAKTCPQALLFCCA